MAECCSGGGNPRPNGDACCSSQTAPAAPCEWFGHMIDNCLQYAVAAKAVGRPIVGILCEFAPRELILAADGVPICLCGGSVQTIPAAEQDLPSNLCPLIKSTYGYHVLGTNPFLEMADLVVGETTCDGKKKMFELMARSRPMYVLELPQKPQDPDALNHWHRELLKFRDFLQDRFHVEITDAKLREAIVAMNRERSLRRNLAATMQADCPPLQGRKLLELKSSISAVAADLAQYERALGLLEAKAPKPAADAPVRVLLTGVPTVHGAERVLELLEQSGGVVVCQENCTGLKPILEDVDPEAPDLMRALAEKYFRLPCSVMTPNDRRLENLRLLVAQYRPECVVELIWQACLTYDVESHRTEQLVEQELNLPYLRIETDYSPSDSARISVRVEALLEAVRSRRGQ